MKIVGFTNWFNGHSSSFQHTETRGMFLRFFDLWSHWSQNGSLCNPAEGITSVLWFSHYHGNHVVHVMDNMDMVYGPWTWSESVHTVKCLNIYTITCALQINYCRTAQCSLAIVSLLSLYLCGEVWKKLCWKSFHMGYVHLDILNFGTTAVRVLIFSPGNSLIQLKNQRSAADQWSLFHWENLTELHHPF
jgi:hypothetical protein